MGNAANAMKFILSEPRPLREAVSIISEFVTEATFKADKDKLEMVAMDPALVAMIDFKLLASAFIEYEISEPVEFSINLESLKIILKRAKPSDTVSISLDMYKNKLKLSFRGETNRSFSISLIESQENQQKLPNLKFSTKITMLSSRFDETMEDMAIIADSVLLTSENDRLLIKAESPFTDANIEIPSSEDTIISTDSSVPVTSKYSLEYLRKISKASRLVDIVSIEFGNDYPMKAEFKLLDKLKLTFVLAPRVSTD